MLEEKDTALPLQTGIFRHADLIKAILKQHVTKRCYCVEHFYFDKTKDLFMRYALL